MRLLGRISRSATAFPPSRPLAFPAILSATAPLSHRRQPARQLFESRATPTMAATDTTMQTFFQSPKFAVVGASTNTAKFGYKVFKWYIDRRLPVTPVNPSAKAIQVGDEEYPTVGSLSQLDSPKDTAISIITPPPVTLKTLQEAKKLGIPSVFLQPGTFDDAVLNFARENFKAVVAGEGGWGGEGWCVLVDGDRGLRSAGKL